ncbi:hypothetical protein J1N35_037307 [Gossypium stocksii]|uniref:Uncharacterized protein n=1 Tax=Gossypium stocksii TaxID=47602 RepID=A0A9D3UJZ4_9ROSI|nr:hypothetical protein J1N35_037307 [Gossypium stocksii]
MDVYEMYSKRTVRGAHSIDSWELKGARGIDLQELKGACNISSHIPKEFTWRGP